MPRSTFWKFWKRLTIWFFNFFFLQFLKYIGIFFYDNDFFTIWPIAKIILDTCDICDGECDCETWITWQLRVTADSICNSCNIWRILGLYKSDLRVFAPIAEQCKMQMRATQGKIWYCTALHCKTEWNIYLSLHYLLKHNAIDSKHLNFFHKCWSGTSFCILLELLPPPVMSLLWQEFTLNLDEAEYYGNFLNS